LKVNPPRLVVLPALNVRPVMVDAPKTAVPVGTVAGVQLAAVLKSELTGAVDQVASWARAGMAASNAAAAAVVSKCLHIVRPLPLALRRTPRRVCESPPAIRPRSRKPRRDWHARRSRIIALCPHQAKTARMPQEASVNWAAYQPLVEIWCVWLRRHSHRPLSRGPRAQSEFAAREAKLSNPKLYFLALTTFTIPNPS